jgi:hypothetical protein
MKRIDLFEGRIELSTSSTDYTVLARVIHYMVSSLLVFASLGLSDFVGRRYSGAAEKIRHVGLVLVFWVWSLYTHNLMLGLGIHWWVVLMLVALVLFPPLMWALRRDIIDPWFAVFWYLFIVQLLVILWAGGAGGRILGK